MKEQRIQPSISKGGARVNYRQRLLTPLRRPIAALTVASITFAGSVLAAPVASAATFTPNVEIVDNPPMPQSCGLDVALVFDLSNSIEKIPGPNGQNGLAGSKYAGNGVVDALQGTQTEIGIYSFASQAPARNNANLSKTSISDAAGANRVKEAVDSLTMPPQNDGGTNWDRGFAQLENSDYDVVYFVTDGIPTQYGDPVRGPGNEANQDTVDSAVRSANAVKNSGARIVPFAVGDALANDSDNSAYVDYISGPGDTFKVPDYEELVDELVEAVSAVCQIAALNEPSYEPKTTPVGQEVTSLPALEDAEGPKPVNWAIDPEFEIPSNWTVVVDPATGVVTATPGEGTENGETIEVPVIATYEDDSTDKPVAKITATLDDAALNEPSYEPKTTPEGTPVDSPIAPVLPEGTTFEIPEDYTPPTGWVVEIDPETGIITTTPPADLKQLTEISVPVEVIYPDDSTDNVEALIVGVPSYISYNDSFTHPGVPVEVDQTGQFDAPNGTVYQVGSVVDEDGNILEGWTVEVDKRTGRLKITPANDADSTKKYWVNVTATTPDGVVKETTAGVQVADQLQNAEIREDGHLWILINGEWVDLGKVVGDPGQPGTPGKDGEDGKNLAIESSVVNEDGSVTIEFSDGSTVTIPAGQPGTPGANLTIESSVVNEDGSVTIVFSDGSTVTIPAGQPGTPGADGEDGKPGTSLTIVSQTKDENGNTVIEFSDGTKVVIENGKDGEDGKYPWPGGSSSSSFGSSERCIQAVGTIGLPLLLLPLAGILSQIRIPVLDTVLANAQSQWHEINTSIQKNSGIYNPQANEIVNRINGELSKFGVNAGQVAGAAGLIIVGTVAAKYINDNCA